LALVDVLNVVQGHEIGGVEPALVVVVDVEEEDASLDVEDGVIARPAADGLDVLDGHRRGAGVDEVELRRVGELLADAEPDGERFGTRGGRRRVIEGADETGEAGEKEQRAHGAIWRVIRRAGRAPGARRQMPGARGQAPEAGRQRPGARGRAPGTSY